MPFQQLRSLLILFKIVFYLLLHQDKSLFRKSKMKISKLDIYTIEEIQSFLESNIVFDLPVVVLDIIADFYMNDISKENNLNWPNKISRQ